MNYVIVAFFGFFGGIFGYLLAIELTKIVIFAMGTGFCGGLTTFSSFALDAVQLVQQQAYGLAFLYLAASIIGGLFFVWLGEVIVRRRVSE